MPATSRAISAVSPRTRCSAPTRARRAARRRVVSAVNFLTFGNRLLEGILAGVPMVGRFADDVAQGIGAGFLTSAVGHAAMQRCEAFHGWDRAAAVETLGAGSKRFLADVRDI